MNINIESKKNKSLFLSQLKPDPSWDLFLSPNTINTLMKVEDEIVENWGLPLSLITPPWQYVLRFLSMPANQLKVVVLGQDPYPQKGVATGRAFEVGNLISWQDTYRNPSLKNIIRAIYKAYSGKIRKYSEIKTEIGQSFHLLPPNQIFDHWEKQGVLFLNTAFTCAIDASNSHNLFWREFTTALLIYIAVQSPKAIWFLWGNNALEMTQDLPIQNQIFAYHPSRCQPRDKDFLYGNVNCFEETKDIVQWASFHKDMELFPAFPPNI
ncbi:MAG: uracil-DNA glycosylase [Bacteroidales bacterium]|nr:uracil-DNA glycosylase [Bacteroidales bacterium]MCF8454396.1 uracil-DNA glycosylase [Bacteroidales bacterium]